MHHFRRYLHQSQAENQSELDAATERRNAIRELLRCIEDRIHPLIAETMRFHA